MELAVSKNVDSVLPAKAAKSPRPRENLQGWRSPARAPRRGRFFDDLGAGKSDNGQNRTARRRGI
jgi:hypothetical protein